MKQYLDLCKLVMMHGVEKGDRTKTGVRAYFGHQMRFNLQDGFPLVTTKKTHMKAIISELLWFLEGSDDERRLAEIHYGKNREELIGKTTIWTENADAQGKVLGYENSDTVKKLGPVYGVQWRELLKYDPEIGYSEYIDQIAIAINKLKTSPEDRRNIVSAWNVGELNEMALPPCHCFMQFNVRPYTYDDRAKLVEERGINSKEFYNIGRGRKDYMTNMDLYEEFDKKYNIPNGKLDCQMYQRSADIFLGVPFNIASYALLTMMIAQVTNLEAGDLIHTLGDCHIYSNHLEQIELQLTREPHQLPLMKINKDVDSINDFKMSDFELTGYTSHEPIKGKMAV